MNAPRHQDLEHPDAAEKRAPGDVLTVSADIEASAQPLTNAQRRELRSRLAHHRTHADEPGVTFSELKAELLARSR